MAPPVPDEWASMIQDFTQQLTDPATVVYDDSDGTTRAVARKNKEQAQILAKEYARFASTLSIPNFADSQTEDQSVPPSSDVAHGRSIDTDATANPLLAAMSLKREVDPEFKTQSDASPGYLTSGPTIIQNDRT